MIKTMGPKVKLSIGHNRLAITAAYPDGTLKYSTTRNGDRISTETPVGKPFNQLALKKIFARLNGIAKPSETNDQRFQRGVKFLEAHVSLASLAETVSK